MRRNDWIKLLERNGWKLVRHGSNHDIYGKDNEWEAVARHTEIDDDLVKKIIKRRGLRQL